MATISSLGTGSGLPLETLLTNLMTAEQAPLLALKTKEASYNARITSLGTLRSVLDTLQTAVKALVPATGKTASDKFAVLSAGVGDTSLATATATTGAVAGTYTLSGITLATAQQIRKTDIPTIDAAGSLNIKVGTGTAVDVAIPSGSTLTQVSTAINDANAGVTATVVNDGTKDHLIITANDTGSANTIAITGTGAAGTVWDSTPFDFNSVAVPTDNSWTATTPSSAQVTINGVVTNSASNTLTGLTGVTINLLKAGSTTLTVTKDLTSGLTSTLNAFVTAYNAAATTMSSLGTYNPTTQVAGALQGNSTLHDAQNQLRSQLFASVGASSTSDYQRLSDIGLSIGKDGKLALDTAKLNKAVKADFGAVSNLVAAAGTAFQTKLEGIAGTTGSIVTAIDGANTMITSNQKSQTALTTRLATIEKRYRAQFTSLDTMIASMKSTSSYLTTQLDSLKNLNAAISK